MRDFVGKTHFSEEMLALDIVVQGSDKITCVVAYIVAVSVEIVVSHHEGQELRWALRTGSWPERL